MPIRASSRAARDRQEWREPDIDCSVLVELVWVVSVLTLRLMSDLIITVFLKSGMNKEFRLHCSFTITEIAALLQSLPYTLNRRTFHLLQMKRDKRGLAQGRICVCN